MELKQEITQIIDALPADALGELLQHLRQVAKAAQEKARLSSHLKTILLEDKEVLERLAK